MLSIQTQQAASVSSIPPIGNLSDKVPLVFHAASKLACIRQCEAMGVETVELQPDLLIDDSKRRDHVGFTAPAKQSWPRAPVWPITFLHGSSVRNDRCQ